MRRIIHSIVLLMALLPTTIMAQEATPLSLQEAMDYAVKNNPNVKNARLDVLIQQAKNAEITGIALPKVNGKGEYTDYVNPMVTFVPGEFIGQPGTFVPVTFMPKHNATASVSASQVLFDGSVLVALQARKAVLDLMDKNARLSEENMRYNVQRAYYALVASKKQFEILSNMLVFNRKLAGDQKALYDAGMIEKIESDRIQVVVNNMSTDSLRISNLIEVSEQALKYQMGMDINIPIVLTDSSVAEKVREGKELLLSGQLDYNNRTEYSLLQSQLKLNEFDLKRHKLSGLPSLAVFGNAAYTYASSNFQDIIKARYIFYSVVGVQLNVPIFDGMQRINRVKQARLNVEKTKNNIADAKLGIDFQEAQSKTSLRNALLALESQQKNLELAGTVLDLATKKYKSGVGSSWEVSQAQTEMLNAQGNFFDATLNVVNASSDLKKALGDFKN